MAEAAYLAASVAITGKMQRNIDKRMKHEAGRPLPDVIHDNFPNLTKYEAWIDLIPAFLGCIVVALVVTGNFRNIRRIVMTLAILLVLRCVCFSVTVLPTPFDVCDPLAVGGCHDCVFSGHTAITLLFASVIYEVYPDMKWPLLAYCILGSLFIVMTRSHYTIDVIVAWIATHSVLCAYKK